jgi:phosphatidylserine/phosphatidylglycerophosphate/cardiolipin synthase-like enzyme
VRALLIEAFQCARRSLLISSPFLTRAAVEADNIVSLIHSAAERIVDVTIYTVLKTSKVGRASDLEATQTDLVAAGAKVLLTTRVHAKTLVCDEVLVVEGSFNWLSASRDPQWARKESSFAVRGRSAQSMAPAIGEEFAALPAQPLEL